ncbi:hypothetical protein EAS62_40015 [Bradyrhizobium zhanjiangense]|uniref:Uncharacterized protein n=1 Tax=Bradyrhizobium zhanjiangense TaxID=1325107 RepID=A0ABY0D9N2_9BRAD|nr:hypothetical protein EAS62_40015 [Bradyrhizobium zhanjiangense]
MTASAAQLFRKFPHTTSLTGQIVHTLGVGYNAPLLFAPQSAASSNWTHQIVRATQGPVGFKFSEQLAVGIFVMEWVADGRVMALMPL